MDNGELSSLDFRFLAKELKERLDGGIFRKAYQYGRKRLVFDIFMPGRGDSMLYADNKRIFITPARKDAPEEPPNFCMFLRKNLDGRHITDVRQHGFDRVIEIETEDSILIFEFLPPGNVILCDKYYNIAMPLEIQKWKHREVKPRESYLFPPGQQDLPAMEIWDFFKIISDSDKDTVSALAVMGFGQAYAAEACKRAGLRADRPAGEVTVDEATALFNAVQQRLPAQSEPCFYNDMVALFPLETRSGACKPASGLSDAFDTFFSKEIDAEEKETVKAAEEKVFGDESERVGRIEKARDEMKVVLAEKKQEKSTKAQLIYRHYDIVSKVLEGLAKAREKSLSWQQIREHVVLDPSPEARAIKEIMENEGKVIITVEGSDIELDFRKSAEENAGQLFEGAKKISRKLDRIESLPAPQPKPMEKIVEEIQATLTGKKARPAKPRKAAKPRKGKRWYEAYRWFASSEGNIVIAGKSAAQNESVIKSRFKEGDIAFHADVHGAAFVVAKAGEAGNVGPLAVKEAVEFAASHSKAWSAGLGEIDVLQFRPGTLSKTTPDGGKLPRGSFYAPRPEKTHEKTEVRLSIGVQVAGAETSNPQAGAAYWARVVAGPLMPVRKSCKYFVTIQPGSIPASELAQKVKNGILAKCMPDHRRAIEALPLEEFAKHIPGGSGSLVG